MNEKSTQTALQPGYKLHWYRIKKILGKGAFGVTYLAHDINLDREVAIKEYLPGQFAVRNKDLTVTPTADEHKEDFKWGLKRFISEARTLTRFEHPNLVRVFNVFEMNKTAYMVMNYEVGKSLQQVLKSRKSLSEQEIMKILQPLMSGLEVMHEQGFIHRDIKPGNIFIRGDGSPVLLDFGSARQTRATEGRGDEDQQTLTTLVSPGYAPIEQYGTQKIRQGPWTDIYGMGATIYRAITGTMPAAAVDRGEAIVHGSKDPYLPLREVYSDRYSEDFLAAIDHALAFKAQDRPQNIAMWRKEFGSDEIETARAAAASEIVDSEADTEKHDKATADTVKLSGREKEVTQKIDSEAETVVRSSLKNADRKTGKHKILIAGTAAVFILIGIFLFMGGEEDEPATETMTTMPETREPQLPAPVEEEPLATEQEAVEVMPPAPMEEELPATPTEKELDRERIRELLSDAREDIDALRLTSPKDDNAFDKYLAVLELDENNTEAKLGIEAISDKYVALAYGAMESNKFANADSYLRKAAAITPGSQKIATARETLQTRISEQESATVQPEAEQPAEPAKTASTSPEQPAEEPNASFWEKVKEWHDEQVEESKRNPPQENPLDDRVKDAFGN